MANLISVGGNWNTAASWGLIHSASMQNTGSTSTVWPNAAIGYGPTWAGDNIEVDGVMMYIEYRSAAPNGWMKVVLRNSTDSTDAATVTIDVADLPSAPISGDGGFYVFFKFSAAVTLTTGKNFCIGVQAQNGTQVYAYKTATANDFNRLLRRTTTAAPQAGDSMWVVGEVTGQGTGNNITITYDNNVADAYAALWIGNRGILDVANAATTQLIMAGYFYVTAGGTFQQGTVANPIGSAYTHTLQFNCVADNGYIFSCRSGGTVISQGNPLTYDRCLQAADYGGWCDVPTGTNPMVTRYYGQLMTEANGYTVGTNININGTNYPIRTATADGGLSLQITKSSAAIANAYYMLTNVAALTTSVETGWLTGDDIGIAPTDLTYTHYERKTLGADASGTTLTLPSALAYLHEGTAPIQAEIINLTRNVIWKCNNAAYGFYWVIGAKASVDIDWVILSGFGSSSYIKTQTGGSFNAQRCAVKDCRSTPFILNHAAVDNVTIKDNVGYNVASYSSEYGIKITLATTGTNIIIDGNWFIANAASHALYSADAGITIINNIMAGSKANGFYITEPGATIGTFNNNKAHSNYENGFTFNTLTGSIGDGQIAYRNRGYTAPACGFELLLGFGLNIGTLICFGNYSANLYVTGAEITFTGFDGKGYLGTPTLYGFNLAAVVAKLKFIDSDFGTASGNKTAHTTADIAATPPNVPLYVDLENTKLGSGDGLEVVGMSTPESFVRSSDHGQVGGSFKSWFLRGVIEKDSTYYNTAAPSQRLTPNSHDYKLKSGIKRFSIESGETATVKANVRKSSVAAGGADYDGNHPRLICKANPLMGIATDQVLDTGAAAVNTWEELSGVTPAIDADGVLEVYVDVDGDLGFVNVDDWSVA